MKKIILLISCCITAMTYATVIEVRSIFVEPYPALLTKADSMERICGYENIDTTYYYQIGYWETQCFKFYDVFSHYDTIHDQIDTLIEVTRVNWHIVDGGRPIDTTFSKGNIFYKCFEGGNWPKWTFANYGGNYEFKHPTSGAYICWGISKSRFGLKELENHCGYKKLQLLDSSLYVDIDMNYSYWGLLVKDSLNNIIQADSGREVPMYQDSACLIIQRPRPSPVIELKEAGLYSISFIQIKKTFHEWDTTWVYFAGDTATTYVRVPDCITGIKNTIVNNNDVQVRVLDGKQLQFICANSRALDFAVYSVDGKKMYSGAVRNGSIMDVSAYENGMYIVSLSENGSMVYTTKVVLH